MPVPVYRGIIYNQGERTYNVYALIASDVIRVQSRHFGLTGNGHNDYASCPELLHWRLAARGRSSRAGARGIIRWQELAAALLIQLSKLLFSAAIFRKEFHLFLCKIGHGLWNDFPGLVRILFRNEFLLTHHCDILLRIISAKSKLLLAFFTDTSVWASVQSINFLQRLGR